MIYAIGLDSDSTFIHFLAESTRHGVDVQPINLRAVVQSGDWKIVVGDIGSSFVSVLDERIALDPEGAYYSRVIDISSVQKDVLRAGRWRNLVFGLQAWLEAIPGVVVNRPGAHLHNFTKPLHEVFLRQHGFAVPESITSSNRERLLEFVSRGRSVVKPVSGIRANTTFIGASSLEQFDASLGPIHLQRYVRGDDVRVHVVGHSVHSELIRSVDVDYRNSPHELKFFPHQLPGDLRHKVVQVTAEMGLILAGWDFKLDADGRYWCLEANPMPGYDGYDRRLGGAITGSLLNTLLRRDE